jgi:hypothetical protein
MPLTLTLTEGVIPQEAESTAVKRITDAMLKWHGLEGNSVMTPNVTAHVVVVPKNRSFSGGQPFDGVWIEWKVPGFAFSDRALQEGFFKEATDIIVELSGGKQPRDNIYSNVVHTVDGTWNMDGKAMTNEQLGAAIATG